MKAQHRRPMPYHPRLEFVIGLLGLAICGLGVGLVTADVLEKRPTEVRPQEPTPTTMINSSAIVPETTTTVEPTTTTMPRSAGRVPAPVLKKAAATVAPSSTTRPPKRRRLRSRSHSSTSARQDRGLRVAITAHEHFRTSPRKRVLRASSPVMGRLLSTPMP